MKKSKCKHSVIIGETCLECKTNLVTGERDFREKEADK